MNISITRLVNTLFVIAFSATAQVCSAQVVKDSVRISAVDSAKQVKTPPSAIGDTVKTVTKPKKFQPNPKKSGLYSSIVPGLGQAYNRQYWKVPVVYVGIGIAGYFYVRNLNNYQSYRQAYISRINNPNPTDKYVNQYTQEQLQQLQNDSKKYLDMTVLFSSIGYVLQIVDAVTSAHLKNFDISRDISMQMHPIIVPGGAGMAMVVNFK